MDNFREVFYFCTSKVAVTAPQQCGAVIAFSSSLSRMNGVGYNNVDNSAGDLSFIFGASFNTIGAEDMIPFSALTSPEGLEDEDQIQVAYTDDRGLTQMHDFFYFGEWYNEDMDPVSEEDGIPLGGSAWFISSSPKTITTSGEVRKSNYIHTFTEPSALIASAFPQSFCPNSANVSWGVSDETQIQTAYIDDRGLTQMHDYFYFGSWYNEDMDELSEDDAIVSSGTGFWIILQDPSETFSEVSPLAD